MFSACRDKDVDRSFEEWAEASLPELARSALNVDAQDLTRESDYVWGVPLKGVTIALKDNKGKVIKAFKYMERRGQDEIWRSNTRLFAIFMYGRDRLMCCTVLYNVVGNVCTKPNTYEYSYKHIVSVETREDEFELTSVAPG
jgi:hypothetical protein